MDILREIEKSEKITLLKIKRKKDEIEAINLLKSNNFGNNQNYIFGESFKYEYYSNNISLKIEDLYIKGFFLFFTLFFLFFITLIYINESVVESTLQFYITRSILIGYFVLFLIYFKKLKSKKNILYILLLRFLKISFILKYPNRLYRNVLIFRKNK